MWRSGSQHADARLVVPGKARCNARDVFGYFDNDAVDRAPFDARRLAARLP